MRNHVTHILIATLAFLAVLVSFNWLMDPYRIFKAPLISGFNTPKSELAIHERIFKTVSLSHYPADTVILGTSRSAVGLSPNHPALGTNAISLAIASQPYRETRMLFDLMSDRRAIKTFIIGLDFFVSNNLLQDPPDFVPENFTNDRIWKLAISGSTLMDSALTLANRKVIRNVNISEKGQIVWEEMCLKEANGHREWMLNSERDYLNSDYLPPPSYSFNFNTTNGVIPPLEHIRAIFARAYRERIALKLLISPSHARQWETLAAAGLWNKWEAWKHLVVQINEEEAKRAGQSPFPLWDFSGYNSISTESVPALDDTKTIMRWYLDSSHYTPATGNLVIDRIFNFKHPNRTVPDDFGILLTSRNIDAHLANIRVAREHYRQTHPEEIAEIAELAREASNQRLKSIK